MHYTIPLKLTIKIININRGSFRIQLQLQSFKRKNPYIFTLQVNKKETLWKRTCCIGHSIDLLQMLANDLNFEANVYLVEDGFYGSKINGSWNGLIGDLHRKKAELAVGQLTITKARMDVVDFVSPFMEIKQAIIMLNRPDNSMNHNFIEFNLLSCVEVNLLWTFITVFFICFIVIYCYEYTTLKWQGTTQHEANDGKILWLKTLTYVAGITFQRDLGGRNPTGVGARLTAVVVAFGMVIAMTAYTATLTAKKVKQEEENAFKGMDDERVRLVKYTTLILILFKWPMSFIVC